MEARLGWEETGGGGRGGGRGKGTGGCSLGLGEAATGPQDELALLISFLSIQPCSFLFWFCPAFLPIPLFQPKLTRYGPSGQTCPPDFIPLNSTLLLSVLILPCLSPHSSFPAKINSKVLILLSIKRCKNNFPCLKRKSWVCSTIVS